MIRFEGVTKTYNNIGGLRDVDIHIAKGDFVFLVGPSGAGKTTFIKLITKELNPESGKIFVDGKDITHLSNRKIPQLRRSIGIVFHPHRLHMTGTMCLHIGIHGVLFRSADIAHRSGQHTGHTLELILHAPETACCKYCLLFSHSSYLFVRRECKYTNYPQHIKKRVSLQQRLAALHKYSQLVLVFPSVCTIFA